MLHTSDSTTNAAHIHHHTTSSQQSFCNAPRSWCFRHRHRIIIALILLAVIIVGSITAFIYFRKITALIHKVLKYRITGYFLMIISVVLQSLLFLPTLPITLTAGYLYGIWVGSIVMHIASVSGAIVGFLVSRFLARDFLRSKLLGIQSSSSSSSSSVQSMNVSSSSDPATSALLENSNLLLLSPNQQSNNGPISSRGLLAQMREEECLQNSLDDSDIEDHHLHEETAGSDIEQLQQLQGHTSSSAQWDNDDESRIDHLTPISLFAPSGGANDDTATTSLPPHSLPISPSSSTPPLQYKSLHMEETHDMVLSQSPPHSHVPTNRDYSSEDSDASLSASGRVRHSHLQQRATPKKQLYLSSSTASSTTTTTTPPASSTSASMLPSSVISSLLISDSTPNTTTTASTVQSTTSPSKFTLPPLPRHLHSLGVSSSTSNHSTIRGQSFEAIHISSDPKLHPITTPHRHNKTVDMCTDDITDMSPTTTTTTSTTSSDSDEIPSITSRAFWEQIDELMSESGYALVFLLRFSPLHPYGLFNYLFGLTSVQFFHYVCASAMSMLPTTIMEVYLGSALRNVQEIIDVSQNSRPIAPELPLEGVELFDDVNQENMRHIIEREQIPEVLHQETKSTRETVVFWCGLIFSLLSAIVLTFYIRYTLRIRLQQVRAIKKQQQQQQQQQHDNMQRYAGDSNSSLASSSE